MVAVILPPAAHRMGTDAIVQYVRDMLQHPADAGAAHHTMDRGTAELISRMLTDGASPPAWVCDCDTRDGCDNRICRLAHLMRWAAAAKATIASCTPEHARP